MKKWQFISFVLALCFIFSVFAFLNKETLVGKEEQTTEQSDTIGGADDGSTASESTEPEPEPVPATWVEVKDAGVNFTAVDETDSEYGLGGIAFEGLNKEDVYRVVFETEDYIDLYYDFEKPYFDEANVLLKYSTVRLTELLDGVIAGISEFYIYDMSNWFADATAFDTRFYDDRVCLVKLYKLEGDLCTVDTTDSVNLTQITSSSALVAENNAAFDYEEITGGTRTLIKIDLPAGAPFDSKYASTIMNCEDGDEDMTAMSYFVRQEGNSLYYIIYERECCCYYGICNAAWGEPIGGQATSSMLIFPDLPS